MDLPIRILVLRRDRVMDDEVYGDAYRDELKFRPKTANPKEGLPGRRNARRGCHEYARLTRGQLRGHACGEEPRFLINVANRRRTGWDADRIEDVVRTAFEDLHDYAGPESALLGHTSGRFGISPEHVLRLLDLDPNGRTAAGLLPQLKPSDPFAAFKRHLIKCGKGARRNRVRRAVLRATRTDLEDVFDHELVVDIDADPARPDGPPAAIALAHRIAADVVEPLGVATVEPSRNRRGAYVRFRVRREGPASQFNAMIDALKRHLVREYNTAGTAAWVDKVGGKLSWWEPNPAFDERAFWSCEPWQTNPDAMTAGERYTWAKHRCGFRDARGREIRWAYDPKFEPLVRVGNDLITFALHALTEDDDGGDRRTDAYRRLLEAAPIDERALAARIPARCFRDCSLARSPSLPSADEFAVGETPHATPRPGRTSARPDTSGHGRGGVIPSLAPGQAIVSLSSAARPLMVSVDPCPCRLRLSN